LLNDVVANYLATLSEIDFFDAFGAILRANAFYDVHLTHGTAEFGKDFIAKSRVASDVVQYAIQVKVGDLNQGAFREVRNQIEDIRLSTLGHPNFDTQLHRRGVLATTGRLTGNAPTLAQNYKQQHDSDVFTFSVWEIDDLLSMMVDDPETGLAGEPEAPLLGAVAAIHQGTFGEEDLYELSAGWGDPAGGTSEIWKAALFALVVSNRLSRARRLDLAALTGAHLVRAAWTRTVEVKPVPEEVAAVAEVGKGMLVHYARTLREEVTSDGADASSRLLAGARVAPMLGYPVTCLRLLELFGLAGLAASGEGERRAFQEACARLVTGESGASHPISSHWAVCIVPATLLLWSIDTELAGRWLMAICVWLADQYENGGAGLAEPWATPQEEVDRLFGAAFEHISIQPGPGCFLASVLLDVSAALELQEIYDSLINEIMAVRICPTVVECDESLGLYQDAPTGVHIEVCVEYDGHYSDSLGWQCSAPHRRAQRLRLQDEGRPWDLLAICSVMRDRCFPLVIRQLAGLSTE
jgi:hypothetical protein